MANLDMKSVTSLILGGGRGTRLYPLTKIRAKPAVPLASKYRLIDIPISTCLHSGINKIYVVTQFLSVSLHQHIRQTYRFDNFDGGFVELLAAQQTMESETAWFEGTADAVRKNLIYFDDHNCKYVLILSGDQLYRMDYRKMLQTHIDSKADVTIASIPVSRSAAHAWATVSSFRSGCRCMSAQRRHSASSQPFSSSRLVNRRRGWKKRPRAVCTWFST